MLEQADLSEKVSKEDYKTQAKALGKKLYELQQAVKKQKLPVIVLLEGWDAAGKGGLISDLILNFDPRGCRVHTVSPATELEKREPVLWRYWRMIPKAGEIAVLDRSWYLDVSTACPEENVCGAELQRRLAAINAFERELTDAGYLILKFFIHIDRKEQKRRLQKLADDPATSWRATELDFKRNRKYEIYYRAYDEMLRATDTPFAPWRLIPGTDRRAAALSLLRTAADEIAAALDRRPEPEEPGAADPGDYRLVPMPKLSEIPLIRTIGRREYGQRLEALQRRLSRLHEDLYRKRIPAVIVYEGWDAAGKGGNIRRVAKALDPRGYEVVPIAAPSPDEAARHYLWRFWKALPRDGHIAVFDRSWYGRVLVERVEGLCAETEWKRAYREINGFERQLFDWGAVVLKFWLQIDKDEQLRRFEARKASPDKRWKLTDEDWRNREKWDRYEVCADDMLRYTSTDFAPWHVIESQDKKFGRVQTLELIVEAFEKRCKRAVEKRKD